MPSNIQELYRQSVRPLPARDRLQLAALILNELTPALDATDEAHSPRRKGDITRFFGAWSSGDPDSANNERIDADLAREYGTTHDE